MEATLNWLWEKILSLILKGKRLEIPMVKAMLQATTLARSRITVSIVRSAGFETLSALTPPRPHTSFLRGVFYPFGWLTQMGK
jgi:hypothetical protein